MRVKLLGALVLMIMSLANAVHAETTNTVLYLGTPQSGTVAGKCNNGRWLKSKNAEHYVKWNNVCDTLKAKNKSGQHKNILKLLSSPVTDCPSRSPTAVYHVDWDNQKILFTYCTNIDFATPFTLTHP